MKKLILGFVIILIIAGCTNQNTLNETHKLEDVIKPQKQINKDVILQDPYVVIEDSYNEIDGNEKGIQYGVGKVSERKGEGAKIDIPMHEAEYQFKSDSLSYEFDTSVFDDVKKAELRDLIPMVMIDGDLYLDTGKESDINARCGVMDGKITSTVGAQETPTQNNQSNFGKDFEYQHVDQNNIDIVINKKWMRFRKEEDDLGLKLTTYNVTPKGLTLVFNQSGATPSGELDTSSRYWLESQKDDGWVPVEMLPLQHKIAWTDESYPIAMNDSTEFEVNWEWLYGELTYGNYRIGKEIMDFRSTGNYDTYSYYGYFKIIKCEVSK